jgi:type I site-specific restriction endonuclease
MTGSRPEDCPNAAVAKPCPMDTREYIAWAHRIEQQLADRAVEREAERIARHEALTRTSTVINELRLEVDKEFKSTKSNVKSLQDIATSLEALLQGVMGRPGMVSQVADHEQRLDRIEEMLQEIATMTRANNQTIEAANRELRLMQRVLYGVAGVVILLQFIGLDGIRRIFLS